MILTLILSTLLVTGDDVAARKIKTTRDEAGQLNRKLFKDGDKEYPYWLYVPRNAKENAPLILFLHGSGEREGGSKGPHQVGIAPHIDKQKDFPFYVVIPQFSKQGSWKAEGTDAKRAMAIMDDVIKQYKINEKKLYLTGLSMGGNGTWENAVAYPDKWAAIAPVCGYHTKMGNFYSGLGEGKLETIKNLPIWCFHGDKDASVNVKQSREAMKILWNAGCHPNYTEYPGVGHNCWDAAYSNPELYKWFLSHERK